MADTDQGHELINLYVDNVQVYSSDVSFAITEAMLPTLSAENATFLGYFDESGTQYATGDILSGVIQLHLYSQWKYHPAKISGQILFDIAEAIRDLTGTTIKYTPKQFADAIRTMI